MKDLKLRRTTRYLLYASIFLILVVSILGFLMVRHASNSLISMIHYRMLDISNTAAAMLNGDELQKLTAEDENTEAYQRALRTLAYFQENIDLKYIYCIQDLGNQRFAFSIDPTVTDPGVFGEPITFTNALYQASLGTASVDLEPYEDRWGRFYSAYSPVYNSQRQIAGIVAVDFSADWYDAQIRSMRRTVVLTGVMALLAGAVIFYIITQSLQKNIRSLYGQLNNLAENISLLIGEMDGNKPRPEVKEQAPAPQRLTGSDIDSLGVKIGEMQQELKEHVARVRAQAYVDALTGVRNHTAYLDTVRHLNQMIQNEEAHFSVSVFDLNGLKGINDKEGHGNGDAALIDVAGILSGIYGNENVFRVGGDEFVAILRENREKWLDDLFVQTDLAFTKKNSQPRMYAAPLAVSKGYAIFNPRKDDDYRSVFRRADEHMYEDKKNYYTRYGDRRQR